jgi:hypothetical protein
MAESGTGTYEALPIGASEACVRFIAGDVIDAFAHAIQSFNPIHMDGEWAQRNTPYPDRVAHGVMTAALMSRPMVQFCERFGVHTALAVIDVEVPEARRRRRHGHDDGAAGPRRSTQSAASGSRSSRAISTENW